MHKLFLSTCAILFLSGCVSEAERLAQRNQALEIEAKTLLESELYDPSSVQYEGIKVVNAMERALDKGDLNIPRGVCGRVNAKNRFGGYVGFRPFIWLEGAAEVSYPLREGAENIFVSGYGSVEWSEYCSEREDKDLYQSDEEILSYFMKTASVENGEAAFARCQACHQISRSKNNRIGPNLFGVVGRPIASELGYSYSDAMSSAEGSWNRTNLNEFIKSPNEMFPGTKASFAGVLNPKTRADIIVYLESQSATTP